MRGSRISIASYNVHAWNGMDRSYNPRRIIQVLDELKADVIALQEACFPENEAFSRLMQDITKTTGLELIAGPTFCRNGENFGNVLLTRYPVSRLRRLDLSVRSREPRGALDVDLDVNGTILRVVATHLGLRASERRAQVDILLESLSIGHVQYTVVMGDFNIWSPLSPAKHRLTKRLGKGPTLATYPTMFPLFALDRIFVRPKKILKEFTVHKSVTAKIASDHLPIKAVLELG
ncbi:endonuclease/exonuclease/phosphatase family protein [Desulfomonile tiedjei]|uniref:Metal-dependent hydrolase n=1 Tax=Desulfomonile tiedjei (strain ATCC 49306 / DSM 6799 / DCB-1) TaxID=706587 RepID=I4C6Z4_DESTA|nr:endonuclease/exonuclease/phosphatase family protein [Desulfomonile tiedjei]AFM25335.1 metal-dependent hydrolase [Desulfomonile tiedjei DSM 6799]